MTKYTLIVIFDGLKLDDRLRRGDSLPGLIEKLQADLLLFKMRRNDLSHFYEERGNGRIPYLFSK